MGAAALADVVLVLHGLLALALVGLLPMVWLGSAAGWRWVRVWRLRALHLLALTIVATTALLGLPCPLTVLEDRLRGLDATAPGCIERHVEALLYWDVPAEWFTLAYIGYALAAAVTWFRCPPDRGATRSP